MKKGKEPRDVHDRYFTPQPLADALVARLTSRVGTTVRGIDPAAGEGAFVRAMVGVGVEEGLAFDPFVPLNFPVKDVSGWGHVRVPWEGSDAIPGPRLIVTNPPFTGQGEFVAATVAARRPSDVVAFLLRLSFFGGARSDFLTRYPPTGLIPVANRPNFGTVELAHRATFHTLDVLSACQVMVPGEGSDNAEYALFVWHDGPTFIDAPVVWREKGARGSK